MLNFIKNNERGNECERDLETQKQRLRDLELEGKTEKQRHKQRGREKQAYERVRETVVERHRNKKNCDRGRERKRDGDRERISYERGRPFEGERHSYQRETEKYKQSNKYTIKGSVTRKKSPNDYKSCPKMILLENF